MARVQASVASYLSGVGKPAALAMYDRVTGAEVEYGETNHFNTASIVKVDILSTLLLQAQHAGRALTSTEHAEATKMITKSDNAAATSLWNDIGGVSGLGAANKTFGLTHTVGGASGQWGLTSTTAADQLRLLQVVAGTGPLTAVSRKYLLGLMSQVDSTQRWGVPSVASKTATSVYVKNGWLSYSKDKYLWIVNTIGRVVEPGHDWLVVVLSSHQSTMSGGITVLQHAAQLAVDGMRTDAAS